MVQQEELLSYIFVTPLPISSKNSFTLENPASFFPKSAGFVNTTSELPDISTQNSSKTYQNGYEVEFLSKKMISGNSGAVFCFGV